MTAGAKDSKGKLGAESGSKASTLMVRQLIFAMMKDRRERAKMDRVRRGLNIHLGVSSGAVIKLSNKSPSGMG